MSAVFGRFLASRPVRTLDQERSSRAVRVDRRRHDLVPLSESDKWQQVSFFRACAATLEGNVDTVARLLRDGLDVRRVDSDGR